MNKAALILARHGNTFEAHETPTFVGAKTDMKLTAEGESQAENLAKELQPHFPLGAIIAGPLLRTRRTAEIVAARASNVFIVDERLTEIDYGLWENKTSAAVAESYGADVLEKWEKEGVWPEDMRFAPSQEKLERNIHAFLDEQHKKLAVPNATPRLAVTSNGILRFVRRALTGQAAGTDSKVKTGHYCVLIPTATGWNIEAWNRKPLT